jgi:RNA polymerase sigma-70 factor (ECF subfamily)
LGLAIDLLTVDVPVQLEEFLGGFVANPRTLSCASRKRPRARLPIHLNKEEVNELFASSLPMLRKAARKMFRSPQDSEDVLQEALLLAFRKLHQFQGRASFSTWLHSIVRNTSRMHYRRAKADRTISHEDYFGEDAPVLETAFVDRKPTPEEMVINQERSQILTKATRELPARYNAATSLFYLHGLGEEDTANALGITISALKARLHRSRLLLFDRIRGAFLLESVPHRINRCHHVSPKNSASNWHLPHRAHREM